MKEQAKIEQQSTPGTFSVGIDTPGTFGDHMGLTIMCSRCGEVIYSGTVGPGISTTIGFNHQCKATEGSGHDATHS